MVYIWIEDKKSGLKFWTDLCKLLFGDKVIVESKDNAGLLVRAVEKLTDTKNTYYILIDDVFDNAMSVSHISKLKNLILNKDNVVLLEDYISLEASLLSYSDLITYLQLQKDLTYCKEEVSVRDFLLHTYDNNDSAYSDADAVKDYRNKHKVLKNYTLESISSSVLKNLTRNSGFEVDKNKIGACWLDSCCSYNDKYEYCNRNCLCYDKAIDLINKSLLLNIINKVVIK